jgi:chloramphenicol O-acetyltransferase type A
VDQFEKRRDRFNFFESFENPLLNICFELEVPDFRPFCKQHNYPPFHFFLYCLFRSLDKIDNFKYRIYQGEVIKVSKLIGSYTVIDENNLFNYTRFDNHSELKPFIKNSLESKVQAEASPALINTGLELTERELKDYVFITSIPWLKFTAIEHPVYRYKSADIPAIAWGRFTSLSEGKLLIPFAAQAHHGFVDAYHVHLLSKVMAQTISELMA